MADPIVQQIVQKSYVPRLRPLPWGERPEEDLQCDIIGWDGRLSHQRSWQIVAAVRLG